MKELIEKKELQELIHAACMAREMAYAPYSHYHVGAALLTKDGRIFQGSNIENASYGATNCAERTAFFKAVSEGARCFRAIAIAGGMVGKTSEEYAYPCGICRQVMQEFCENDFQIVVVKSFTEYKIYTLAQMLPFSFKGELIQ